VYGRMGKKDEATRVYNELLSQDLTDEEFFQVGVGLFRGEQYVQAGEAFKKAIAKNPAFRDAYYNQAQSIYSLASVLEDERAKAKATETKAIDAKLKPLYAELQTAAEKARELDPANRNVMALLARAYRGMADVVDPKESMEWKTKTLKVMEAHRDLPIEVMDVMVTNENGEIKLTGNLINLKSTEGAPVKVKVSFLGKDGSVLGSQDVTVTAPKTEDQVEFKAALKTDVPLGGWKYEILK
jgi:tetratricopeptide (TPR) repeat protein